MPYTTIDNPQLFFQTKLYTGNGSTQTITFDVTDTSMQPDLIWIKDRGDANWHNISDSTRGTSKVIYPNATNAEGTNPYVNAFNTNGFGIGSSGTDVNGNTNSYVAWCWKESADAGMDIIAYAGDAVAGRNISHSLSAVPHVIIVKNRTNAIKWVVYHHKNTAAPETDHLQLNANSATSDDDSTWDDTAPGSSVFRVKSSTSVNGSSANYVSYLWRGVRGFSSFGSYRGNGDASNGQFIYTGFRVSWFLCKNTQDSGDNWILHDNKRNTFNVTDEGLAPNDPTAEFTDVDMDFLSNGVKMRNNTGRANSAKSFIYLAFGSAPLVNSKSVPCQAV